MSVALDVPLADGRVLRAYDSGGSGPVIMWFHGSPQTGRVLPPVLEAAAARGIRMLSYARPSYGGSTPRPGRDVASAAADLAAVADAAGVEQFATLGASGGGPHALAGAAILPGRVTAAATLAGIAPFEDDSGWWGGMAAPGGLHAARDGRDARASFAETEEFEPTSFSGADYAALDGPWASLGKDVEASAQWGDDGLIDDDLAFTRPWGVDLADIRVPVLLVQGSDDRVIPPEHAERLHRSIGSSELWRRAGVGHISVLDAVPDAMDWILAQER
ncbi:alpha/beta fold hydrolase [uncultured Microbacterium sp.]|uniref:alpha/beta fold hydrolase n=1 Tax=uncultured Microbacterium sp. TaxID=191216 RepID=UPI002609AAE4|nr:alpha/beta hydrolase [uncultured Microbacterium sp.]